MSVKHFTVHIWTKTSSIKLVIWGCNVIYKLPPHEVIRDEPHYKYSLVRNDADCTATSHSEGSSQLRVKAHVKHQWEEKSPSITSLSCLSLSCTKWCTNRDCVSHVKQPQQTSSRGNENTEREREREKSPSWNQSSSCFQDSPFWLCLQIWCLPAERVVLWFTPHLLALKTFIKYVTLSTRTQGLVFCSCDNSFLLSRARGKKRLPASSILVVNLCSSFAIAAALAPAVFSLLASNINKNSSQNYRGSGLRCQGLNPEQHWCAFKTLNCNVLKLSNPEKPSLYDCFVHFKTDFSQNNSRVYSCTQANQS